MDNDSDTDYIPSEEENSLESSDDEDFRADEYQTQTDSHNDYMLEDERGYVAHLETDTIQNPPEVEIISEIDSEGNLIQVNDLVGYNDNGYALTKQMDSEGNLFLVNNLVEYNDNGDTSAKQINSEGNLLLVNDLVEYTDNGNASAKQIDLEGNLFQVNNLVEYNDNGNSSANPAEVNQNTLRKGDTVYVYQCTFCYYQTTHLQRLKIHIQRCKKSPHKKLLNCPKCRIEYSYDDLTNEHCIPLEGDDKERDIFHCPACEFENEDNVQVPTLKKIHPSCNIPFVCPRCKVRIAGIDVLKTHLASMHQISIIYKCESCDNSFIREQELEDHKKIHANPKEPRIIKCSHCDLHFPTQKEMKQHMKRIEWAEQVKKNKEIRIAKEKAIGKTKQVKNYKVISEKKEEMQPVRKYKIMSEKELEVVQTEPVENYELISTKEDEIGQTELVNKYKEISQEMEKIGQMEPVRKYKVVSEKAEETGQAEPIMKYKVITEKEDEIGQTELVQEYTEMSDEIEEIGQTNLVQEYNEKEKEIGQTELVEKFQENSEMEEMRLVDGEMNNEYEEMEQEYEEIEQEYGEVEQEDGEMEQEIGEMEREDGEIEREDGEIEQEDGEMDHEYAEVEQEDGELEQEDGEMEQEFGDMVQEDGEVEQEFGEMVQEDGEVEQEVGEMEQEDEGREHRDLGREEKGDFADNNEIITIEFVSDSEEEVDTTEEEPSANETSFEHDNPEPAETVAKKNAFNCNECEFEVKDQVCLLIHEMLIHDKKDKFGVYRCPLANCQHATKIKPIFRTHLVRFHDCDLDMFYARDLVAKNPRRLIIHAASVHQKNEIESKDANERSKRSFSAPRKYLSEQHMKKFVESVNIPKEDPAVNTADKKLFRCKSCEFATINKLCYFKHIKKAHKTTKKPDDADQLLLCKYCGQKFSGRYQSAWHRFDVHKDNTELLKWRLKCKSCDFEDCSKLVAHKHGMEHRSGSVSFQKSYHGRPTGWIHIRYKQLYVKLNKLPDNFLRNCGNVGGKLEKAREKNNRHRDSPYSSRRRTAKLLETPGIDTVDDNKLKAHDGSVDKVLDRKLSGNEDVREKNNALPSTEVIFDGTDELDESDYDDEFVLTTSEFFTCSSCNFETENESYLKPHKVVAHGINYNEKKYPCPDCDFESNYKRSYTRHITSLHNYKIENLLTDQQIEEQLSRKRPPKPINEYPCISNNWTYSCHQCNFKTKDKNNYKTHILDVHESKTKDHFSDRRTEITEKYSVPDEEEETDNTTEMMMETGEFGHVSDDEEQRSENAGNMVEEEGELCYVPAKGGNRRRRRSPTKKRMPNKVYCRRCERSFEDKYQLHVHLLKMHGSKTELSKWRMRCTACGFVTTQKRYALSHALIKHGDTSAPKTVEFEMIYNNSFYAIYNCKCPRKALHCCPKCDYKSATDGGLKRHVKRHDNPNFVPLYEMTRRKVRSIEARRERMKDHGRKGITAEQLMKILELNKVDKYSPVKNFVKKPDNEVITIEIIPEATGDKKKPSQASSSLNPFTGELILEASDDEAGESSVKHSNISTQPSYKCSNSGCTYICKDFEKISRHVKMCPLAKPRRKLDQKFTCHMCNQVMTKRSLLQNHCNDHAETLDQPDLVVMFSEVTNGDFACDFELQADLEQSKPDLAEDNLPKEKSRVTYKCWMCGYLVQAKTTLSNHTNIHAREDGNFKLKVRYTKFRNDKIEGTVIMQADPNFIINKRRGGTKTTVVQPEYDPSLIVFSCSDCNFKSNDEAALESHKKLHWTPQKDALFKAQKWYTCSFCFFHCFEAETMKKHNDWHRKHPTSTGVMKKVGTNSWFLN